MTISAIIIKIAVSLVALWLVDWYPKIVWDCFLVGGVIIPCWVLIFKILT